MITYITLAGIVGYGGGRHLEAGAGGWQVSLYVCAMCRYAASLMGSIGVGVGLDRRRRLYMPN